MNKNCMTMFWVAFALLAVGCSKRDVAPAVDHGPLSACYFRTHGSGTCTTSFQRLMVDPQSAIGKNISIVGYLAPRRGVALLYPSENDFAHDVVVNAISIDSKDAALLTDRWYQVVSVRGRFDVVVDPVEPWFGEIDSLSEVNAVGAMGREAPVVIYEKLPSRSGK
ncbi:hypothetical protein [Stenotrophomonas sp.]|uniref:hypothetical protein n=1 Tax=Stenotrophomonas sp. TaxID=69392 RepID=UPI0028979372|nr:hypothetical protein [Stenotrophomonas sp.]